MTMNRFLSKLFFYLVFIVYFLSAAGIYNSGDATQYFTTEALIYYQNPYLESFSKDKHFFVFPDIFYVNGHTMSVRGYVQSLITIPLHFLAIILSPFYSLKHFFPPSTGSPNFAYELSITSLLSIFSVTGLYFFFKTCSIVTKNKLLSVFSSLFLAFGTYFWKYNNSYIRQILVVPILGLTCYLLSKSTNKSNFNKWFGYIILLFSISFGIDIFLFIGLGIFIFFSLLLSKSYSRIAPIFYLLSLIIIISQVLLNYQWYESPLSSQTVNQVTVKTVLEKKAKQAWLSTPLYPSIFDVLFGAGKIHENSFRNFDSLPSEIKIFASLDYARKYNFFGIFIVSPFLFFALLSFLNKNLIKKYRLLAMYCFIASAVGILGNTKVLVFWGGNQYDIRYFYPYCLPLAILATIGVDSCNSGIKKYLLTFIYVLTGIFSMFMGWLGILNMFHPSLSGERRIWVDIFSAKKILQSTPFDQIKHYTFMNRGNILIAVVLIFGFEIISNLIAKKPTGCLKKLRKVFCY